jgi:hypothetical protein
MADLRENVIEWLCGQDTLTATLSQQLYISKVEELAEKYPDKVKIIDRNEDGSIVAHLPIKALKLNIIERDLTDEQRTEISDRLNRCKLDATCEEN